MNCAFVPNMFFEDCLKLNYIEYVNDNMVCMKTNDYSKLPLFIPENIQLECSLSMLQFVSAAYYKLVAAFQNEDRAIIVLNKDVKRE